MPRPASEPLTALADEQPRPTERPPKACGANIQPEQAMTRPTLTVVGKGELVADTRIADCLRAALALAEAGKVDGLLLMVQESGEDVPEFHVPSPDPLRTVALLEVFLPDVKAVALGLVE